MARRPHPAARSQFACDPIALQPPSRRTPVLILKPAEVRVMAAVFVRGVVPNADQLKVLGGALVRIAEEDALLAALAAQPLPVEPPPKVPA